jgi:hypothetical protein
MAMLPCMPQPYNNITSFYQFHEDVEEPRQHRSRRGARHESESERDILRTTHIAHRTLEP